MKLVRQTKLHFREGNSDKVYEVDLCEVGDQFTVNFRYGKRGADLKEGTKTTSPVSRDEADKIFQKLVDEKTRKGYHAVGSQNKEEADKPKTIISQDVDEEARKNAVLAPLQHPNAKSHPRIERIIWRAGELKIKEAAEYLPNLIGTGKDLRDYCIAWSLGFCGSADSIPVLEKLTAHSAEFVRRIAREAILKLADEPTRTSLREQAISELPANLKASAQSVDAENFEAALRRELENQKRGSYNVLTQIYEIDTKLTRPALLKILAEAPLKPRYFKPIRYIFKMAEYRHDAEVFGIIAKRFEIEKAGFHASWWDTVYLQDESGRWSSVKRKDELAKDNSRLAYSSKTKDYLRRRTWRTLRRLGEIGDTDYVKMAVGSLLAYTDADALEPRTATFYDYRHTGTYNWRNPKITTVRYDAFAPYLLFNHLLHENSQRYEYKTNSRAFRLIDDNSNAVTNAREEAFPKLWEAQPAGLLHLIAESNCSQVHEFAVKVLRDCPDFLKKLDTEIILLMLSRPYETTAKLGFELAVAKYDAANPNVELVMAIAVSSYAEARSEAFKWMDAKRDLYAKNAALMLKLLTSEHQDTRKFAAKLLKATNYSSSEAQNLIALLISEILLFDETKREAAKDLGEAIFQGFSKELRVINLEVVRDLLTHPLVEVQILGGNILLNHETPAENLSDDLINSLINSQFEEMRAIGIKLFGQLPDENLLKRESVIMTLLSHELIDVHNSTRPIVARLTAKYPQFTESLVNSIYVRLLQSETAEGLNSRLLEVLRDIPDWENYASYEVARLLAKADSAQANEIGGIILQKRAAEWSEDVSIDEIVDFTNAEVLSIRQASWQFAEKNVEKIRANVSDLIRTLDSKWEDSREFWFEFFRSKLTENELTPEVLIAISDSVKPETQKFGRDLLLKYFKTENGSEYLLKLSEHPSANMQLFATNYLENYAANEPDTIARLAPYFVRLLSLVNRSRPAKDRSLQFLENEALKNEESAKIAADILARHSATIAVGDRARMIEMMLKIQRKFPDISLPIKIKSAEVRGSAV